MEKAYKHVSYLFVAILLLIVAGFYKTYFGLFPTFDKVTVIQHIHGTLFLAWFLLLIIQPILIRRRKYKWHRVLGKFTYVLVPVLVISIFFIARELYINGLTHLPHEKAVATLFVPFLQIVDFVALYILAIHYKSGCSLPYAVYDRHFTGDSGCRIPADIHLFYGDERCPGFFLRVSFDRPDPGRADRL